MANRKSNKTQKQVYKAAKKVAKKNPTLFIVLVIFILLIGVGIGVGYYLYSNGYFGKPQNSGGTTTTPKKPITPVSVNGDVQIYSIEMRDKYGDSLFIKYKDYDILIDAGDKGDGEFVRDFVDSHISDDKNLDLLIVTHCHSDHMGGLTKIANDDNKPKALDNVSTISNIIDFGHSRSTNTMYKTYVTLRDSYLAKGTNYYSAYEAAKHVGGMQNVINFDDLKIEILDTFNYASTDTDFTSSSVKYNEYSVASLITYKNTKLFCAGDLEDTGEKTLIEHASETSLKDVKKDDTVIYKACHHGTDVGTANNKSTGATSKNGGNRMALLKLLNPDYCFVSSAITQSDHPFPRAIATMLYFTDNLYFNGTNGTLCFDLDGINVGVQGLGATTNYVLDGFDIKYDEEKNYKYTETSWYKNHVFKGEKNWYTGDLTNPTDKDLTEWYLAKLKVDYPN